MTKDESVYNASLLLVEHFSHCQARDGRGRHSRVFSYFLHPEVSFVGVGRSKKVAEGAKPYPEHVVPCTTLIDESARLLSSGMPKEQIARLLAKHWKIALLSKEEATYLDAKDGLNLKSSMPKEWSFENGDTFARLKLANIELLPL